MPVATLNCPDTGVIIPAWQCPETGTKFPTGATPSTRSALMSAMPFCPSPLAATPDMLAYVPKFRSPFGNDRYGDCVSAEEAFSKTCINPEKFNSQSAVDQLSEICIAWARQHSVLNGAALDEVLDWMAEKGYQIGPQLYNDGSKSTVDFENETVLRAALAQGPVKVAIAAGALPGGAGSRDGWYALSTNSRRTDHSTTICGYGPAGWLYQQLGVPLPSALQSDQQGYLHYTWATIGFTSHAWLRGTVDEAWIRNPTTIGVPPLVPPAPPPGPGPGPGPGPAPGPAPIVVALDLGVALPAGKYAIVITQRPDL